MGGWGVQGVEVVYIFRPLKERLSSVSVTPMTSTPALSASASSSSASRLGVFSL